MVWIIILFILLLLVWRSHCSNLGFKWFGFLLILFYRLSLKIIYIFTFIYSTIILMVLFLLNLLFLLLNIFIVIVIVFVVILILHLLILNLTIPIGNITFIIIPLYFIVIIEFPLYYGFLISTQWYHIRIIIGKSHIRDLIRMPRIAIEARIFHVCGKSI